MHLFLAVAQLYVSPVLWLCFTWIHGHLSFSAAVQALTRPFLLRRAKYGYHFCKPKRARWVEEAVICWLEIMPPSMPSGPEHSEWKRGRKGRMSLHVISALKKYVKLSLWNAYRFLTIPQWPHFIMSVILSSTSCFIFLLNVSTSESISLFISVSETTTSVSSTCAGRHGH